MVNYEQDLERARERTLRKREKLLEICCGGNSKGSQRQTGLVEKISEVVRNHPASSAGTSLALGFALATCNESFLHEIKKGLNEVAERMSSGASTLAQETFATAQETLARSLSRGTSEIVRHIIAKI